MTEEKSRHNAQLQTAEAIKKELSLQNVELMGKVSKMELERAQATDSQESEKRWAELQQALRIAEAQSTSLRAVGLSLRTHAAVVLVRV
jgi:predicted nuclease of restriction endonuclease-like (RecB) superfamily